MRSAFLRSRALASVDSLRRVACQPKLAEPLASEGWTTDMFVDAVYQSLKGSKP